MSRQGYSLKLLYNVHFLFYAGTGFREADRHMSTNCTRHGVFGGKESNPQRFGCS